MRTFIEVELPHAAQDYIRGRQHDVRTALSASGLASCFRWTQVANMHLTLRFLGETTARQQQYLADGLAVVAKEWPTLSLCAGQLGGFPSLQRPRVLWLGVAGDLDSLQGIQTQVERLVQETGFEAESRGYSPHLTIARVRKECPPREAQNAGAILSQWVEEQAEGSAGVPFCVERLVHMRSDLHSSGAAYTPLSTHEFTG